MVLLAIGFASVAWTRLNIAIILPEVMQGIGVTSLAVGGFLATLSVLGNGLAEPFMGHLSDRIGRRLALTIGLAGFSLFSLLTAFATNLPEMVGIRVLLGVLQGLYIPTYLAFVGGTFEKRRGFWIEGLVGMFTIGSAINPLTTRWLFDATGGAWQTPSLVYGIFGLVLAAGIFALGKGGIYDRARTRQAAEAAASDGVVAPAFEPLRSQFDRSMLLIALALVCWGFTQYAYLGLFVTYLRQGQGFSLESATTAASLASWITFAAAFFVGWVSDQIGRRRTLMIAGAVAAMLAYPLFAWTTTLWVAVGVAAVFGACNGAFFGLGVAYAQDLARGRNLGGRSGMITGVGHFTSGFGGGAAALVASTFGFQAIGLELAALCVCMVVCMYLTVDRAHLTRMAERQARAVATAAS
ncbi:MAG: MFS transporter [Chloroflexi bacterium]|nr:MFS transporter [Chloroflexota bacterium]